ncbi:MAG: acyl carrier protein [Clostridia bacterium]|nr:acyl carrier protein [Clostridia bacterium]
MVLEKLIDIISEQLELDKSVVKATSSFTDDLGAGSLDMIDLAMSIEDEFEIELSDDNIGKLKTVGDLAKFIESKVNA